MEFGCFWKIHSYPVIQAIVSIYIRLQFHCILPLDSTSISSGVVCLYLRTQSRSILLLLHKVVSHYCSSEEFYCSLVCIVTTIRQYRSFPLVFSPKILFFMHEWFLQNISPYSFWFYIWFCLAGHRPINSIVLLYFMVAEFIFWYLIITCYAYSISTIFSQDAFGWGIQFAIGFWRVSCYFSPFLMFGIYQCLDFFYMFYYGGGGVSILYNILPKTLHRSQLF